MNKLEHRNVVYIIDNAKGSQDYFYIYYKGELIDSGHSLSTSGLSSVLEKISGYSSVQYLSLTDDQFETLDTNIFCN